MAPDGLASDALAVLPAFGPGALIGAERERRRHPGGLRSCAIASGIGVFGAGVILHHGMTVRGLSTAATFWAVAATGTAAGLGEYGLALGLAHLLLRRVSSWIEQHAPPSEEGPK